MKVSELKEGMLLRFKECRNYKFLHDSGDNHWLECGKMDMTQTIRGGLWLGQPLIIYLGQEEMPNFSHYGSFHKVRKVLVQGRIAMMWPENWKYVEAL